MSAVVIKSKIFGEMFGIDEMQALFSEEALLARYLAVEIALAKVQATLGLIPTEVAVAITQAVAVEQLDWERLAQRTEMVGYPILPLVEQIVEKTPDGYGQYCHWGATA